MLCPAGDLFFWVLFFVFVFGQWQLHHHFCTVGGPVDKLHAAAVGVYDLLHHMQAQNMRGVLPFRFAVQHGQHALRVAGAVILYGQVQRCFVGIRVESQRDRPRIMAHGVLQHIFQRTGQQSGISVQDGGFYCRGNAAIQCAAGGQGVLTKSRHHPAQKRPRLGGPAAQGLGAVLQLAGQVQVLNQAADFFALGADAARFLSGCCGQGGLPLQLFRPAQDQCQRSADIMADPGDPLGSGGIPPGNDLIAAAQLLAGFVQLLGKLPRKTGGRQADVPPCAKVSSPAVTVCRLLLPRQLKNRQHPSTTSRSSTMVG